MLVLSRRKEEKIIITVPPSSVEQKIEVVIVDVSGAVDVMDRRVRLGFDADPEVEIWRKEIAH